MIELQQQFASSNLWAIFPGTLASGLDYARKGSAAGLKCATQKGEADAARAYITGKALDLYSDNSTMGRYGNVAVLPVQGALRPKPSFSFWGFGYGSSNYLQLARDLRRAVDDDSIDHIILDIDSPGGLVNGTEEFAALVAQAAEEKHVVAYVQNMAASAAYWVASQADEIVAGPTAELGSIGVMAVYVDWSKFDERVGIEEVVFRSAQSPNKNANPRTDKGAELLQARIDAQAAVFIAGVAAGRDKTPEGVVTEFGQGDLSVGEKAVAVGLADRQGSFDALLSELVQRTNETYGVNPMTDKATPTALAPGLYQVGSDGTPHPFQITAETVQALAPAVAEAFKAEGHAAGAEEGAKTARETIQAIETEFPEPAVRAVVDEMKFADDVTPESVALEIVKRSRAGNLDFSAALESDTPAPLSQEEPDDTPAHLKAVNAADDADVAELNAGRG